MQRHFQDVIPKTARQYLAQSPYSTARELIEHVMHEEMEQKDICWTSSEAQQLFLQMVEWPIEMQVPPSASWSAQCMRHYIKAIELSKESSDGLEEKLMEMYWEWNEYARDERSQHVKKQSSYRIYYPLDSPMDHHTEEEEEEDGLMRKPLHNVDPIALRLFPQFSLVGLAMWPSGYILAEWIACHPQQFSGKRVLELGSGAGLTGISLMRYCSPPPKSIWLTDYLERVLGNARHNLLLNGLDPVCNGFDLEPGNDPSKMISDQKSKTEQHDVHISKLDWVECSSTDQLREINADVLLGADVVYDPDVVPPLLNVVRLCFEVNRQLRALFVVTKRTESTFALFEEECRDNGIASRSVTDPLAMARPCFSSVADRKSITVFELSPQEAMNVQEHVIE